MLRPTLQDGHARLTALLLVRRFLPGADESRELTSAIELL